MNGYEVRAGHYALEFGTTSDFDLIRTLLPARGLVLDVPCGSGRLLDLFADGATDVIMVDAEPRMTAVCLQRVKDMHLSHRISVKTADMRSLLLHERPDVVLVSHGGIQMLETLQEASQALEALTRLMEPGAILYVDVADPWGACTEGRALLPPFMQAGRGTTGVQSFGGERESMTRRWRLKWGANAIEVEFDYEVVDRADESDTEHYASRSRWLRISPEFLLREFKRLNLETIAMLAHHDGRPYEVGSPRCILIGKA